MMLKNFLSATILFFLVFSLGGCQTVSTAKSNRQENKEAQEALSAVAGALRGKPLSDEELKNLENQIRHDKEAQSAIRVITESVGGQAPSVKYCPIDGARYAPHMEICPEHRVSLESVDP